MELLHVADAVAREKHIDKDIVLEALEEAIQKAAKSKYGHGQDIRAKIDRKTGVVDLKRYRHVVEEMPTHDADAEDEFDAPSTEGLILLKDAKRIKPDVVLHYTIKPNIYGTLAAAITRTPAINNVCGLGTVFLKNNLVSLVAKGLYKLAFAFPNKVFFQNQDDLNLFAENKLIDESITDILPGSGIDLSKFHPLKKARDKKFSFLMISRLIHDKGVLEYIEAIKILRGRGVDAEFKLLGPKDPLHARGIQLDIIDGWIESNSVDYLGKTDDVKPFLAEADCVVLPSYREGTPRSLLEAASVCKPIVATDVPGCREVVVHGHNGLLCNLKDANDLADKMMEMAAYDAERIHQMGENGRQRVLENFDESIVIDKYIGAINEILK